MIFPLHRVPPPVFTKIVNCLDPPEILFLSQTSQKTRNIMEGYSKSAIDMKIFDSDIFRRVEFCPAGDEASKITLLVNDESHCPEHSKIWNFGDQKAQVHSNNYPMSTETFWKDEWEGMKAIIGFLKEMFDVRTVSLGTTCNEDSETCYGILEHIQKHQLKIHALKWNCPGSKLSIAEKVLTAAIDTDHLVFHSLPNEIFKFDRFHEYSLEYLRLADAHWITVPNLCALINCSRVVLSAARFSSQELNVFLKHWMVNGGNITSWFIMTNQIVNGQALLNGLNTELRKDDTWMLRKPDGKAFGVKYTENWYSVEINLESNH